MNECLSALSKILSLNFPLYFQGYYQSLQSLLKRSLCRPTVVLKHASLSAAVTLALRPLIAANFSDKLTSTFLIHILSVPALLSHIQMLAPEVLYFSPGFYFPVNLTSFLLSLV